MVQLLFRFTVYLICMLSVQSSWAQKSSSGSDFSLGVSGGALITSEVPGWDRVATSYGVHFGFPAWELPMEFSVSTGGSEDNRLTTAKLVMLGEHWVDDELGVLYWIGPNYLSLDGEAMDEPESSLGLTIGGGLKVRLKGGLYLRLDMAVISSPGSSAYSGFGLVFDI